MLAFYFHKKKNNTIPKLLTSLILLIGFQQFPVFFVGGSFKLYELLGIILLCIRGIRWKKDLLVVLIFTFFVVSPAISLLSFFMCDDVSSYYRLYPNVRNTFRHNVYIFPFLQLIFMLVNYVVLYNIYINEKIYKRFDLILKWIVIVGTGIAIYSIFAMFTGDPISHLPNIIQNKHIYDFRSSGLSQEPSNYILFQGWIVLFCWYSKRFMSKAIWMAIFTVNVLSLILTFSSTLVLFVGVVTLMIFLFSRAYMKFVYIGTFVVLIWGTYLSLSKYVDVEMLNYAMVQKLEDFVVGKDDAGGSGGFRHYESSLGWIIFKENPLLGVGVGNSTYFMHEAARKTPIIPMDEQLTENSFPPNTFSCVFAEQGILGGMSFVAMLIVIVCRLWKYKKVKYGKLLLTANLFNIGCLFVIAPQYSMYLWVYMFMSLGYMRYVKKRSIHRKLLLLRII